MRMLILHVDYFKSEITQKGRSKFIEKPTERTIEAREALIILAGVERTDERGPQKISEKAALEIDKLSRQLKVQNIILHPFAHLFAELASPEVAVLLLDSVNRELLKMGYNSRRSPFGWFNTLELKAKGHPLSRIARSITLD